MKNSLVLLVVLLTVLRVDAQDISCSSPEFGAEIDRYLSGSVPLIDVETLHSDYPSFLLLDAREFEEYEISHLPGAMYVGYDEFDVESLEGFEKHTPIVVYCSIGYRSEKIGERLLAFGFTNVQNLYGSIFEWANRNYPVDDIKGQRTNKVHGYNKAWSKWLSNPNIERVW